MIIEQSVTLFCLKKIMNEWITKFKLNLNISSKFYQIYYFYRKINTISDVKRKSFTGY
jgi:hypothetical protein